MLDVNRSSLLLWPVKEDMISAEKSSNRWEACAAAKRPDKEINLGVKAAPQCGKSRREPEFVLFGFVRAVSSGPLAGRRLCAEEYSWGTWRPDDSGPALGNRGDHDDKPAARIVGTQSPPPRPSGPLRLRGRQPRCWVRFQSATGVVITAAVTP